MKNWMTNGRSRLGLLAWVPLMMLLSVGSAHGNPNVSLQRLYEEGRRAYAAGNLETAVMKLGQVVEARPDHAQSRALLLRARMELAKDPGRDSRQRVGQVRLEKVDVEDVTITEFVAYLRAVIASANEERGEEDGFVPNILLRGEDLNGTRFTLQLRNIPLDEVLRMAGELTGVRFRYEPHAVFGTAIGE